MIFKYFNIIIIVVLSSVNLWGQDKNEYSMSFIKVDGNRFVDEKGKTFVFRGVSMSDPDRLEKAGYWNDTYFAEAKKWNCNVVRFPVHPSAWRERGREEYLKLLDEGIRLAEKYRMYVIIDWHSIGNLRTELYHHDRYFTTKTETYNFWRTIAERYKGNPVVAVYELFNEPTTTNGKLGQTTWQQHREMMEELIGIIYAHDNTVIPLVAGFNFAYFLTDVIKDPVMHPGVAYTSHPYPQKRPQPWEEKWEEDWGHVADTYPMICTEFGFMSADGRGAHIPVISDESYGHAIINYFEKKGISWTAWVFDPHWSPQLFENWDFEPTVQGKLFKEKLEKLNPKN
jgi:aryl-phospho-beta-D-glucosidase BglC (GH1 family)